MFLLAPLVEYLIGDFPGQHHRILRLVVRVHTEVYLRRLTGEIGKGELRRQLVPLGIEDVERQDGRVRQHIVDILQGRVFSVT